MVLSVERELTIVGGKVRRLPLLSGAALPVRGALLSWHSTGYVHALVAGEAFAGVCSQSARGGGYVEAMTGQFSMLSLAAISTVDATDIATATPIYASDDATLTATAGGNTLIGVVAGIDGSRVNLTVSTVDAIGATAASATAAASSATAAAASAVAAAASAVTAASYVPTLPGAGTFKLQSIDNVLTWVADP